MFRPALASVLLAAAFGAQAATDQQALDGCIASWGSKSPFKKGTPATSVIATGVKVFALSHITGTAYSADEFEVAMRENLETLAEAVEFTQR